MGTPQSQALWRIQIPPTAPDLVPTLPISCSVAQHLVIELDCSPHAEPEEERKDGLRTAYLNAQGYRVLRFWNQQVNHELEGVLQAIYAALTDS